MAARAALSARSGPHQRVVLAVHFRISQADEWADKGMVGRGGAVYRWIRSTERAVVPRVDGLVFVSEWARAAVRAWLPQVGRVPSIVVHNFVADPQAGARRQPGYAVPDVPAPRPLAPGDLVSVGSLEAVKNHRYLLRVLAAARRSGHAYTLDVFGEGVERVRSRPSRVGVGEVHADVAQAGSAEQGVRAGVGDDIGVAVPDEAPRPFEGDATEDGDADQRVGVAGRRRRHSLAGGRRRGPVAEQVAEGEREIRRWQRGRNAEAAIGIIIGRRQARSLR